MRSQRCARIRRATSSAAKTPLQRSRRLALQHMHIARRAAWASGAPCWGGGPWIGVHMYRTDHIARQTLHPRDLLSGRALDGRGRRVRICSSVLRAFRMAHPRAPPAAAAAGASAAALGAAPLASSHAPRRCHQLRPRSSSDGGAARPRRRFSCSVAPCSPAGSGDKRRMRRVKTSLQRCWCGTDAACGFGCGGVPPAAVEPRSLKPAAHCPFRK